MQTFSPVYAIMDYLLTGKRMGARPMRDQGSLVAGVLLVKAGCWTQAPRSNPHCCLGATMMSVCVLAVGWMTSSFSCLFYRGVGRAEVLVKTWRHRGHCGCEGLCMGYM